MAPDSSTLTVLNRRARIPDHVVHRQFAAETVVLNLKTGFYHGLNPTAGRMLEVVGESPTIGRAARRLADEYGLPVATIEADLVEFCSALAERELLELGDG